MIKINDVSFHYKKGTPILDRIQSTLQSGHIYGLLGLNGVGKTTLLKIIAGLLFPRKGDLQVNDFNPENRTTPFLSDIYFITDEVELPNWSITDIIRVYAPLYPKFDLSYFEQLLQAFQIDTKKQVNDFSYGQRKKVNIAFGLATNVSTLLMDEPTNGLDIPSKAQFRKIISQFVAEDKVIIISTHQIRDIHNLIDHLLILDNNRLILDDSIYQLGKKMKFSTDPSDVEQAWYSEVTIHGPVSLLPNSLEEDSSFDIEFFFNALSANRNIITELKRQQPIMSKNIDFKKLSLAIQEFWLMNKTKILTIPFVVLILLTIYYLWYDTPLAKYHLFNMYPNKESFIADLAYYRGLDNRVVILLLLPVYIIVCSQPYLSKLNTSVRTTMIPFTRGERLITLWIYTLFIIGFVLGSFIGIDALIGQLLKSSYLAQSIQYMESRGDLYHQFQVGSYFGNLDNKVYYIILSFTLVGTAIYHLAALFFKKFSVLKFLLVIIIFIVVLVNITLKIHELNQEVSITAINSTAANWAIILFIALVVGLIITTTYYKLKEKEI